MDMDEAPVVRIRGLVKNYKEVHAVRGIDLDVPRGSLFGLIGSDGAGKSSTMKTVAGVMGMFASSCISDLLTQKSKYRAV